MQKGKADSVSILSSLPEDVALKIASLLQVRIWLETLLKLYCDHEFHFTLHRKALIFYWPFCVVLNLVQKGAGFVCLRLLFEVLEGTLLLRLHLGVSCQKQMALTLFLPFPFFFHSFSQFQGILHWFSSIGGTPYLFFNLVYTKFCTFSMKLKSLC